MESLGFRANDSGRQREGEREEKEEATDVWVWPGVGCRVEEKAAMHVDSYQFNTNKKKTRRKSYLSDALAS